MSTRRSVIVLVAFLALAMVAPASQPAVSAPVSVKVSIAVPDTDVVLAGTLLLPAGATEEASVPGVLLVTGSGPQDRDETLMGVKPFKVLAEGLVAHGYAVLRYDDRGTQGLGIGQSTGSFAGSTTADFADDAAAAASFLAEQPAIDGSRVVVCGHSTGGLVTAKLLGRGEVPAAAVLLAAPSVIGWELLAYQSNKMVRETDKIQPTGLSDDQLDELDRVQTAVIKSVAVGTEEEQKEAARGAIAFNVGLAGGDLSEFTPEMMDAAIEQALAPLRDPWMAYFLSYDPAEDLAAASVPVLAVFGGLDVQVAPEQNVERMSAHLRASRHELSTSITLESQNHLFQKAETGLIMEYATAGEPMQPLLIDLMVAWMDRVLED